MNSPDVLRALEGYFAALDVGDAVVAASYFTEDARYSHPPYPDEDPRAARHEVTGHCALIALFRRRGPRTVRRHLLAVLSDADVVMVDGVIEDEDGAATASFVASIRIDPGTARFRDYVAYVSRPPVLSQL